jgi:predicted DNA-binding transcriptional regulator YafY
MNGLGTRGRSPGEPAEATARKIAILVELIRSRRISMAHIQSKYDISERQTSRDLQELRRIGAGLGFEIGKRNANGFVELAAFASRPGAIVARENNLRSLMVEIFKAFGEPLQGLTDGMEAGAPIDSSFVRVVMPRLAAGSSVAVLLEKFQAAWESCARVRFRYAGKEREVEPSAAFVRSGRYYLLGRQVAPAVAWRLYSIDEIPGTVARCGTFTPKVPPAEYLAADSIGFIKSGSKHRVDVTVSKRLARTAASRRWQQAQSVHNNPDGTVTISFEVGEVDEAVRWALGFGDEAWISSPPEAVARARETAAAIAARYE